MTTQPLSIHDPATCCPTGACDAEADARLARFAADLPAATGVAVRRLNLAQGPNAFAADAAVREALEPAKTAARDVASPAAPAGGCCEGSTEPAPSSSDTSEGDCGGGSMASATHRSEPREGGCGGLARHSETTTGRLHPSERHEGGCGSMGPHADAPAAAPAGGLCGSSSPKTQGAHAVRCC